MCGTARGDRCAVLNDDVIRLQRDTYGRPTTNWSIEHDFHFGGYAKRNPELNAFIDDFSRRHKLILDWVYVAKMMYGVFALVRRGRFQPGTRIVAVVTGRDDVRVA